MRTTPPSPPPSALGAAATAAPPAAAPAAAPAGASGELGEKLRASFAELATPDASGKELFVCKARLFGRLGEAGVSSGAAKIEAWRYLDPLSSGTVRWEGYAKAGASLVKKVRGKKATLAEHALAAVVAGAAPPAAEQREFRGGGWDVWRRWEQRARTRGFADGVIGEAKAELGELTVGEVRRRTARNIWCVKHPDDLFTADAELEKRLEAGEPEMKQLLGRLLGDARARAAPGRRRAPSSLKLEAAERLGQKLYIAAWTGDALALRQLLAAAPPDKFEEVCDYRGLLGDTPLFRAAYYGREECVSLLLEHGARPDLGSYHMGEADFDQRCLKIEARLAARELETAANDGGGDDDAAFGDLAPWVAVQRMQHKHGRMTAPRAARLKALGVLRPSDGGGEGVLRAKEVADEVGATPLIVAARWGKPAIVKWLLGFGADPAQPASTGRWRGLTARQVAEQAASQRSQPKDLRRAQVECVQLLAEKEAPLARETRLAAEAKLRSAMLPPEGEAITSARLAKAVAAAEKAHVAPDLVAHAAEVRAKVAAEEAARRALRSALAAAAARSTPPRSRRRSARRGARGSASTR